MQHAAFPAVAAPGIRGTAERVAAAVLLVAAAPLMAATAATVAVALGRPVLFRQRRAGLGGEPFTVLKFRTMSDARGSDGALLPDAERLGTTGRILRRLRLDELPQLLAVADGRMAFVGPRPLLPETVAGFGALGVRRGTVRPGLTGWAQVSGNARLPDADKIALDLWYVDRRSAALDALILLDTVRMLLVGERVRRRRVLAARRHIAEGRP